MRWRSFAGALKGHRKILPLLKFRLFRNMAERLPAAADF